MKTLFIDTGTGETLKVVNEQVFLSVGDTVYGIPNDDESIVTQVAYSVNDNTMCIHIK